MKPSERIKEIHEEGMHREGERWLEWDECIIKFLDEQWEKRQKELEDELNFEILKHNELSKLGK